MQKMQKQTLKDFLCTAAIFATVLLSLALVAGQEFFENAVYFDKITKSLKLFDLSISVDQNTLGVIEGVFDFNAMLFGQGFVTFLKCAVEFCIEYICQALALLYRLAQLVVGVGL